MRTRLNMTPRRLVSLILLTGFINWNPVLAGRDMTGKQADEPAVARHYTIRPTLSKIKVDGILDEAAWQQAVQIDLAYEWLPGDNTPAPVKSLCLLLYGKNMLYIGFRCLDPQPARIRAHLMDRDALATFLLDDYVSVMIDPFNDERRGFQFRSNPLGIQVDAAFKDASFTDLAGDEDFSWDAIWDSAGKITDSGYTVEMAIPFSQLRFPRHRGKQTWGFSISRSYPRSVRCWLGSHPRDRNIHCTLCQANKVGGFEGMKPGHNLEFDPTLTARRTDRREPFPAGDMTAGSFKVEPGITARWSITPNLILNGAVNPDFSQVEADVAQLDVNLRYALRYPEKRPFFLEGADLFQTPFEVVFTRSVVGPEWGIKLTGKEGRSAFGIFSAQDHYLNLMFPSNQGTVQTLQERDVTGGVLRYRLDVGKGSTLGLLYTGKFGDGYYNHAAGLDWFWRLSGAKSIRFQYVRSHTDYPDDIARDFGQEIDPFSGYALSLKFRHFGRNIRYGLSYQDLSPGFRADTGFIPRVDCRWLGAFAGPVIWGKGSGWFEKISLLLVWDRLTESGGDLTDEIFQLVATYNGPWQTTLEPAFIVKKEKYGGLTYDLNIIQNYFEIRPKRGLSFFIQAMAGDGIDYANLRLAHSLYLQPGLNISLGQHLNMRLGNTFNRLSLAGDKIFTANLFQVRVVYNFNARTFIRAILQYTDIDRNLELYTFPVEPETNLLFSQFLFSYKINPRTVLFLGYSDNHQGMIGIDLTRKDRTFFLKIGYALAL